MASLATQVGGEGLDSVVAITGHKDLRFADNYSKIDSKMQKITSMKILNYIEKRRYRDGYIRLDDSKSNKNH